MKYAAAVKNIDSSALSLHWNGNRVTDIFGTDSQAHEFQISLTGIEGDNTLEIRGEGAQDGLGMTINNLRIIKCIGCREN